MKADATRFRGAVAAGVFIGVLVSVVAVKTLDTRSGARSRAASARPCVSQAEMQRRRSVSPAVLTVTEHEVPSFGLRFDPPPPDAHPRLTAAEAYFIATSKFPPPGPSPTVSLGLLTNDGMLSTNADGTVTKMVDNRLTWLVIQDGVVVASLGGPALPGGRRPPSPRCPLGKQFLPVDAMSGELEFVAEIGRPNS